MGEISRKLVRVKLMGCDDTTIMDLGVDAAELAFLERLQRLSKSASNYQCMPTLSVESLETVDHGNE